MRDRRYRYEIRIGFAVFVECTVVGFHVGRQDHGTTDFQGDGAHIIHFGIRCELVLTARVCQQVDIGNNRVVLI